MTYDPYSQQPPRYPPQQPPSQPYQPQFPREAVTTRGEMGQLERIGWAVAVMCTLGVALPFYWARKRKLRRTTVTRYR